MLGGFSNQWSHLPAYCLVAVYRVYLYSQAWTTVPSVRIPSDSKHDSLLDNFSRAVFSDVFASFHSYLSEGQWDGSTDKGTCYRSLKACIQPLEPMSSWREKTNFTSAYVQTPWHPTLHHPLHTQTISFKNLFLLGCGSYCDKPLIQSSCCGDPLL